MYKDINPFGVRLPTPLRAQAEKSADENFRSLNAEIVAQLVTAYSKSRLEHFSDGELIDELIRRYGRDNVAIYLGKRKE